MTGPTAASGRSFVIVIGVGVCFLGHCLAPGLILNDKVVLFIEPSSFFGDTVTSIDPVGENVDTIRESCLMSETTEKAQFKTNLPLIAVWNCCPQTFVHA